MKSSSLLILIILLFSCKKSKDDENIGPINSEYNITITGVVTDQVSGQPVPDAQVFYAIQAAAAPCDCLDSPIRSSTITDKDGKYQLMGIGRSGKLPLSMMPDANVVIARKSGFIGSNRQEIRCLGAQDCRLDIKLYHSCSLNLHIVNDTLNKIDKVSVAFDKLYDFTPNSNNLFVLDCKKRKYDTTLVLNDLWGNGVYVIKVLILGGYYWRAQDLLNEVDITPKPDTLNYSEVSY